MKIKYWGLAWAMLILMLLSGCGNKGPLYLADDEQKLQQQEKTE